MTDNENLDEAEGKELSGYAKQRAKYKEELDAKDATIASLRAEIKENKKAFFKNTLTSQGYKGEFDEFADKYADNLGLDEMVALYKGAYGAPVQQAVAEPEAQPEQPTIGPKSVIGQNPIFKDQPKRFQDLTLEEMKARGRQHPEIFQE